MTVYEALQINRNTIGMFNRNSVRMADIIYLDLYKSFLTRKEAGEDPKDIEMELCKLNRMKPGELNRILKRLSKPIEF